MAYCAALDPHGWEAEKHPGWKEKGWLVLRECRWCDTQYYEGAVDTAQVRAWGEALGGWWWEDFCV